MGRINRAKLIHIHCMITYRTAEPADADTLAALHADSWQRHYRGIFTDEYLDHQIVGERLQVWRERFRSPSPAQYAVIAEEDGIPCGFACTYADYDPTWGALLDNLHVKKEWQRRGIGAKLMRLSARWLQTRNPQGRMYLWVLEENHASRAFYERMGTRYADHSVEHHPGGSGAPIVRCVWDSLEGLVARPDSNGF